jgi:hypothetical protein
LAVARKVSGVRNQDFMAQGTRSKANTWKLFTLCFVFFKVNPEDVTSRIFYVIISVWARQEPSFLDKKEVIKGGEAFCL